MLDGLKRKLLQQILPTRSSRRTPEVIRVTQWAEIRQMYADGIPKKEIARRFGIDVKTVRRAIAEQEAPLSRPSPSRGRRLDRGHHRSAMGHAGESIDCKSAQPKARLKGRGVERPSNQPRDWMIHSIFARD